MVPIERPKIAFDITPQKLHIVAVAPIIASEQDLLCLSHGIYYEASNQGRKGMEAVGFVILNRSKSKNYPHSICDVIKQSVIIRGKRYCQFSWYCKNGDSKLHYIPDNEAFRQSKRLADMLLHKEIDNWMPHVVSFHVVGLHTNWTRNGKLSIFATIGKHVFYKENNPS
jgi:spore germination cell wall hydrolase CwlJ-like protein